MKLENFKPKITTDEARIKETYIEAEDYHHRTKMCVTMQV